jgi:hypothetical protein
MGERKKVEGKKMKEEHQALNFLVSPKSITGLSISFINLTKPQE